MLKQKNESMPSVRPRGRNVKSGNLLPLILRDVIFGNCRDNTVQKYAAIKHDSAKTLPRMLATRNLNSLQEDFLFR